MGPEGRCFLFFWVVLIVLLLLLASPSVYRELGCVCMVSLCNPVYLCSSSPLSPAVLQMSTTQLLKHTPSSVAPTATDQKAQSRFSSSPPGLQEQSRGPSGLTNHCMAHSKQLSFGEVGPAAGRLSPRPQSTLLNGEEDDGGGGARVKKKRKKKDRKEVEPWHKAEKDPKPKKKKEAVEGKELLPRRSKELRKGREPKLAKEPKKVKKSQEARAKSKLKASRDCKSGPSPPKQRGRKAK